MNERCVIQISDRRLTSNGKLIDDEANKAIALTTPDARLTVAFTGLAKAGSFHTRDWLMDAIHDVARSDQSAEGIIKRLANVATKKFTETDAVRDVPQASRRLDIVFGGYSLGSVPPKMFYANVSNLRGDGTIGKFDVEWWIERRPFERSPTFLRSAGFDVATDDKNAAHVIKALQKMIDPQDLLAVLHSHAVKVADSPASKGMIGKQFDTIIVDRDGADPIALGYESDIAKPVSFSPSTITIAGPGQIMMTKDLKFWTDDPDAVVVVPRVHRNAPCPCGSGKRYRECHRP